MSVNSFTTTSVNDDGSFIRTALILDDDNNQGGSIDILNSAGKRVAQINLFYTADEDGNHTWFAADVIDIDKQFKDKTGLVFIDGSRKSMEAGTLVAADFRNKESN